MVLFRRAKVFGPIFLVLGSVLLFSEVQNLSVDQRIETDGKTVNGKVRDKSILKGAKSNAHRAEVDYPVTEKDGVFRQLFIFPEKEYDQLESGGSVAVKYLPSSPAKAIAGEGGKPINAGSSENLVISIIPILLGMVLVWLGFFRKNQQKAATQEGSK